MTVNVAVALLAFVQGYSKAAATITASAQYSASISTYALTINGVTVSGGSATQTSAAVTTSGTVTATIKVTDSRGFTASTTQDFTVQPYSNPTLTSTSLTRTDSSGTADEAGTYLSAYGIGNISSLSNQNTMTMSVAFKTTTGSYGTETAMTSGTAVIVSGLNADVTYVARITLTDRLGNTATAQAVINSQKWAMKFNATATAVAFGKAPEADKVLEIPYDWQIARKNQAATETHYALFDDDSAWTGALGRLSDSEDRLDALEQRLEIVSLNVYTLNSTSALASQGSTSLSRTITRTAGTSAVAVPLNNAWVAVSGSSVSGSTLTVNFINTGTGSHSVWVSVLVIEYK